MILTNIIVASTFLTNILPKFLISDNFNRIILLYNNQTKDLADVTLGILATTAEFHSASWFLQNVDVTLSYKDSQIHKQGLLLIVDIPSIVNSSEWIINMNKTIIFHPRCNTLIISENKPKTDAEILDAVLELWKLSIINVGLIFFGVYNEIYTYNPFVEQKLIKVYSSDNNNLTNQPTAIGLYDRVFFNKITNLNGAMFPIMVGLDLGRVYKKRNPNKPENYTNLGGSEIYAMKMFGKLINASIVYNLQVYHDDDADSEFLVAQNELALPIELPFDESEPDTIVPILYETDENQ